MSCSGLHHVEICVGEENNLMDLLIKGFGFKLIAQQITPLSLKWALRHGTAVFVVTKRTKNYIQQHKSTGESQGKATGPVDQQGAKFPSDDLEHWTVFCCREQTSHVIDSAFNIALVVKDVDKVTKRVQAQGGNVLREPTIIEDSHGQVKYSIVTSCLGNIVHTLIDKTDYSGEFLPGFEKLELTDNFKQDADECLTKSSDIQPYPEHNSINEILKQAFKNQSNFWSNEELKGDLFTHFDHVTYVCEPGRSKKLMEWYESCFGAKRFKLNREETEGGFVVDGVGMRLKAMKYWKCAEVGLTLSSPTIEESSLKLVIAEPLIGYENNQVCNFLRAHKGPGVQHIALHSSNIAAVVKYVAQQGVTFRKAPPTYYQEGIRLEDIKAVGHGDELNLFEELGILLDTENDVFSDTEVCQEKKYLLQVFTTSIFEEDSFFLEIIQRKGAIGFGGGNIKALAQSIIYSQQQEKAKASNVLPS